MPLGRARALLARREAIAYVVSEEDGALTLSGDRGLREQNALLNAVVQGASEAVFVKDLAGRYVLANQITAQILQKPHEKILGKDDFTKIPNGIPSLEDRVNASLMEPRPR